MPKSESRLPSSSPLTAHLCMYVHTYPSQYIMLDRLDYCCNEKPYSFQVTIVTVLGAGGRRACVGDGDSSALRGKSVRASFNSHYTFTFLISLHILTFKKIQ